MKFHLIKQPSSANAQCPIRVIEQSGREVGWINAYLDREYVRCLARTSLRIYAYHLLDFVRWWERFHHTSDIAAGDLTQSILVEYLRFQSSLQPRLSPSTINARIAVVDRALRNQFPEAPWQIACRFHQAFLRRGPMGLGRPRLAISRLRVKAPKPTIVPLSVNEVARFWSSFHTARDLAIVGLMVLHGLRSAEVLALNRDDVLLPEAQLRVHGKGNKLRILPLAPETIQLLDHYLRLERPPTCGAPLLVLLKGAARGARMTPAGLRSLFRYHRLTTGIQLANPHRFRHYSAPRQNTALKGKSRRYRLGINSLASLTICRAVPNATLRYSETMASDLPVPSRFEQQFRGERNW
jgi:integrase/recombinase XerD